MCRLVAFPPGFSRDEAIDIMTDFEKDNKDGTGSAYIKNEEFVVKKWALPLTQVLSRSYGFLEHMPHDGWTIAHVRAASHGVICKENSHPFIVRDLQGKPKAAVVHNGIWKDYHIAKMALRPYVKFESDTDSEVAANILVNSGVDAFVKEVGFGGVYLVLNIDGTLLTAKTSGQLYMVEQKDDTVIIASEFDDDKYKEQVFGNEGWYLFDDKGRFVKHKKKEWSPVVNAYTTNNYSSTNSCAGNVHAAVRSELDYWKDITL